VSARRVLTFGDPHGEGARYRSMRQLARGETIVSTSVSGLTIETDFLFQLAAA